MAARAVTTTVLRFAVVFVFIVSLIGGWTFCMAAAIGLLLGVIAAWVTREN